MLNLKKIILITALLFVISGAAEAAEQRIMAPFGHIVMCMKQPGATACKSRGLRKEFKLTRKRIAQMVMVNRHINHTVHPKKDGNNKGIDIWQVAQSTGDCEDYALRKQRDLVQLGWPTRILRLAVTTYRGQSHAVLIASDKYVLDNIYPEIQKISRYRIKKRQSKKDPRVWVRG